MSDFGGAPTLHLELRTQIDGRWATIPITLRADAADDQQVITILLWNAYRGLKHFIAEAEAA